MGIRFDQVVALELSVTSCELPKPSLANDR
jgi:hypothetical protein